MRDLTDLRLHLPGTNCSVESQHNAGLSGRLETAGRVGKPGVAGVELRKEAASGDAAGLAGLARGGIGQAQFRIRDGGVGWIGNGPGN